MNEPYNQSPIPYTHLCRGLPKMHDVFAGVCEQLLAEALEVAVQQREHAALAVAQHELPRQQATLYGRELALAQIQVVVSLPQVPPAAP